MARVPSISFVEDRLALCVVAAGCRWNRIERRAYRCGSVYVEKENSIQLRTKLRYWLFRGVWIYLLFEMTAFFFFQQNAKGHWCQTLATQLKIGWFVQRFRKGLSLIQKHFCDETSIDLFWIEWIKGVCLLMFTTLGYENLSVSGMKAWIYIIYKIIGDRECLTYNLFSADNYYTYFAWDTVHAEPFYSLLFTSWIFKLEFECWICHDNNVVEIIF